MEQAILKAEVESLRLRIELLENRVNQLELGSRVYQAVYQPNMPVLDCNYKGFSGMGSLPA